MRVYRRLLDAIVPGRCPACGLPAARGYCAACRGDFVPVTAACPRCGVARPERGCPLEGGRWHLAAVVAPFLYTEPLKSELRALKFAGRRGLGRGLGELLAERVLARSQGVDAIVAVPLHRARFLARGYNQAVELARPVSAALRKPLLVRGVTRRRDTPAQARLTAPQRRANLRGAFAVSRALDGARLAIVDDVMTTGATANALALEILRAGAVSVEAWAVARAL